MNNSADLAKTAPAPASRPAVIACALLCFIFIAIHAFRLFNGTIHPDFSTFLIFAAEHVYRDAVYYKDQIEVNPAPFFWIAEFIIRAADFVKLTYTQTTAVFFTGIICICLFLSTQALNQVENLSVTARAKLILILCIFLTFGAGYSATQRDYLVFAFAAPYLIWWWAGRVSGWHIVVPAVLFGFIVVVRPLYALLPIILALSDSVRLRSARPLLAPLYVISGLVAISGTAVSFLAYPEYGDVVLRQIETSRMFPRAPLYTDIFFPHLAMATLISAAIAVCMIIDTRAAVDRRFIRALIAVGALLAASVLSLWSIGLSDYRILPMLGGLLLLVGISFIYCRPLASSLTVGFFMVGYILMMLLLTPTSNTYRLPGNVLGEAIGRAMTAFGPVKYTPMTNSMVSDNFVDARLQLVGYANTFGALRELFGVASIADQLPPKVKQNVEFLQDNFIKITLEKMVKEKPELLLVEFFPNNLQPAWWKGTKDPFSFAAWLCHYPEFRQLWSEYEPVIQMRDYVIYKRKDFQAPPESKQVIEALKAQFFADGSAYDYPHTVNCGGAPHP